MHHICKIVIGSLVIIVGVITGVVCFCAHPWIAQPSSISSNRIILPTQNQIGEPASPSLVASNGEYVLFLSNFSNPNKDEPTYFSGELWAREKATEIQVLVQENAGFDSQSAGNPVVSTLVDSSTHTKYAFVDEGTDTSSRTGIVVNFSTKKSVAINYGGGSKKNYFITSVGGHSYFVFLQPSQFTQPWADAAMYDVAVIALDTMTKISLTHTNQSATYAFSEKDPTIVQKTQWPSTAFTAPNGGDPSLGVIKTVGTITDLIAQALPGAVNAMLSNGK